MIAYARIGFLTLALSLVAASVARAAVLAGPIPATLNRVIDGDTVEVDAVIWLDQTVRVSVRLDGVDAPEIRRSGCAAEKALGETAKRFLAAQLRGAEIALYDVKEGKYAGRVVARLKTGDGADPTAALIENGLAAPRPKRGRGKDWCEAAFAADKKSADRTDAEPNAAAPRSPAAPMRNRVRSFRQAFAPQR